MRERLANASREAKEGMQRVDEIQRWKVHWLRRAVEEARKHLAMGTGAFDSLDITYHPPCVRRLSFQFGPYSAEDTILRVYLHRIESMGGRRRPGQPMAGDLVRWRSHNALFHPHPWPSAVMLLWGSYEHTVGTRDGPVSVGTVGRHEEGPLQSVDPVHCPRYVMIDPRGWHSVRPTEGPAYTLMVVGERYPEEVRETEPHSNEAKGKVEALSPDHKLRLWYDFCTLLGVTPGVGWRQWT